MTTDQLGKGGTIDERDLDRLCVALVNMLYAWWLKHEPAIENDAQTKHVHELVGFDREVA